ncbi:hypothetical protein WJU23_21660 [Prosthecobacter sp. SYSU 5D2]|uniref:hypothetical protein n=1 Tax=Prosthecobacter sp. SYSU 5D2 TaxID=3134134 RepID=UPI0031FE7590
MSRAAALVFTFAVSSLCGQEPVPSLGMPPPPVPGGTAEVIPVAPPLPGQLEAVPVPPPALSPPASPIPIQAPAPAALSPLPGPAPVPAPDPLSGLPPLSGPAPAALPPGLGTPPPMSLAGPPTGPGRPKVGASTSASGQFIVHGDDMTLRNTLSAKCEDISKELRTLLHDKDSWSVPIVVLLNSGEAARKADKAATTVISQLTHGGFHLQVNVNMRPDLRPGDVRKELIRALLAERILRNQKQITTQRKLLLPDWLYLGILEATDYRQRARPSALFAAIFKSGKIFGIEEIIEASASDIDDSLSRTIYQTSCCALVLALLDQPDSGLRMGRFLTSLASDPRSERELLNQWFPNFASSEASLNKWWALQLATLASPGMGEPLSPLDTISALEDALTLRFEAKPSEIPRSSRLVTAPVKPSPASPVRTSRPAISSSTPPAVETAGTEPEAGGEEADKPGFMSRLNPFSRRKTTDDEIAAAMEEAARAEAENAPDLPPAERVTPEPAAAPAAATTTASGRTPLLNRFFDEDKKAEKPPVAKPPAPKRPVEALPAEAPAAPAEDKPSGLNPLNWFKGGKKDQDAPSPEETQAPKKNAKDEKAYLAPTADPLVAHILTGRPITALVMQEVAVEEDGGEKKRFFGLFGKKKPEADPAEPEAPQKPASEPKKSSPPASKPETPAPAPAVEEAPAEPEAEKEKTTRQPLRLRLFGDKKDDAPPEPDAPEPESMPAETASVPSPSPAPARTAPRPQPKPAAKKQEPAKDETAVAAAIPIEDYAAILKRKDLAKILERNINILSALQNRGAVLFRPIATDYMKAMEDIQQGRTKGLDTRLRELRARTQQARAQSDAVRDLLDVHEANDSPAMSGLFDDYLKLPETIENELPARTDPISKYLDALDREFTKE